MRFTLTAALVGAFVLASSSPALAVDDRFVDKETGTNSGPNNCLSQGSPCLTIAHAILQSGPGDTIKVDDTLTAYAESFDLNDGRSIMGVEFVGGDEGTGVEAADVDILPTSGSNGVILGSGTAGTISGLRIKVTNSGKAITDLGGAVQNVTGNTFDIPGDGVGILLVSGATTTISNNVFKSLSSSGDDAGVSVDGQTATIEDNTFNTFNTAIQIGSATGAPNSIVRRNQIVGTQSLPIGGAGIKVIGSLGVTLEENEISAPVGANHMGISIARMGSPVSAVLRRNQIYSHKFGVSAADTDSLTLNSDVIGNSTFFGLSVGDSGDPGDGDVTATNVTIANSGMADIDLASNLLTLNRSIVTNPITDISTIADCAITNSRGPTTGGSNCQTFQTAAAVSFANAPMNDYRLSPPPANAALIDVAGSLPAAPNHLDFEGQKRTMDGDNTCTEVTDIGADEVLPALEEPMFTGGPANASTITTSSTSFTFTTSNTCPGVSFQCSLDNAAFTACTSPASLTNLANGSHLFEVRILDPLLMLPGDEQGRQFNVAVPTPPTPPAPPVKKCKKGQKLKKGKCVKKKRKKK